MALVQMTLFDLEESSYNQEMELTKHVLQLGSGFAGGKKRIKEFALKHPLSKFAKMLKDEYGTGGGSVGKYGIRFQMHDNSGISFDWKNVNGDKFDTLITWTKAAEVISELVKCGEYDLLTLIGDNK